MADEISYQQTIQHAVTGGVTMSISAEAKTASSGTNWFRATVNVLVGGGNLAVGSVGTPLMAYFRNLSAVNYVDIQDGAAGSIITRVPAGGISGPIFLNPSVTLYAIANTDTVLLEYAVFET
jgi:hypothetical protein